MLAQRSFHATVFLLSFTQCIMPFAMPLDDYTWKVLVGLSSRSSSACQLSIVIYLFMVSLCHIASRSRARDYYAISGSNTNQTTSPSGGRANQTKTTYYALTVPARGPRLPALAQPDYLVTNQPWKLSNQTRQPD